MTTKSRLEEAISNGLLLKVAYQGGSQPGSIRAIIPLSIKGEKVRARCYTSSAVKTFFINKLSIIDDEITPSMPRWGHPPEPQYKSISDFVETNRQEILNLGWHLEYRNDGEMEAVILYRRFKDGVPLKSSDIALTYSKYRYKTIPGTEKYNFETFSYEGELEKVINKKPCAVSGKDSPAKTFKSIDDAAIYFLELSRTLEAISNRKSKK